MALEQRGNNSYYYRKERDGQRVVSRYVGCGEGALLIAMCEQERLAELGRARAALRREQQQIHQRHTLLLSTETELRDVVRAVLIANGFHQHKRQWRKSMDTAQAIVPATTTLPVPPDDEALIAEGFRAFRAAMSKPGDLAGKRGKALELAKVHAELERREGVRKVLRDYPVIWPRLRRVLSSAESVMIKAAVDDVVSQEVLEHTLKGLRRELGYQDAPILERLLIEQVALTYFDYDMVQQQYANYAIRSHTLTSGAYWDKRLTSAQSPCASA